MGSYISTTNGKIRQLFIPESVNLFMAEMCWIFIPVFFTFYADVFDYIVKNRT